MYRTTDGGANWTDVSSGLTDIAVDLQIDPFTPTTLYAATRDGVFKTTNSGGLWTNTGCSEVSSIVLSPDSQGTVYCGTFAGVFISTNAGGSWNSMNAGLGDTQVTCIRIDPDGYLFAGTADNGLYRWPLTTGIEEYSSSTTAHVMCSIEPNPATKKARFRYHILDQSEVLITLYKVDGRFLGTIFQGTQNPGIYCIPMTDFDIPSGIYFVKLRTNDAEYIDKFVFIE